MGPLMLGLEADTLTADDCNRLLSPVVGGVILFSRNFRHSAQLVELVGAIRRLRPELLVSVDHEGGRVQRFREGFTPLPPMGTLGALYDQDADAGTALARECGWVLASELLACGVDFSFTPVLDLDYGRSRVIGDRSFHRHPQSAARLARALMAGMDEAGMAAVGKHFPGHGYVEADSHVEAPVDTRSRNQMRDDLAVFEDLIKAGLAAIMPAHVVYSAVDKQPAGFSRLWLQDCLRSELGFEGLIFSDDLGMAGAFAAGSMSARAQTALQAGCDMVLVCNDFDGADEVIRALAGIGPVNARRAQPLRGQPRSGPGLDRLHGDQRWQRAAARLSALAAGHEE